MPINTLIIGFTPLADTANKKPREIREDTYFKDLISQYDIGTIHYATWQSWKEIINDIDPIIVVILGGSYEAQEVKRYKGDNLLYAIGSLGSVFRRKADVESKKEKQKTIFSEIESLVRDMKTKGEEEIASIRKFSGLSYKELYDTIKKALISDNKELQQNAWDLMFGEGDRPSNIIWMRTQMMCEIWEGADWQGREKLMLMSMERHIDQGTARKMDNFMDADGQEYYQYMFLDPYGNDLNHIRRLPFASKGQERYAYESMLEQHEIPSNYMRIQVEANQVREKWDECIKEECKKVQKVLEEYEKDPMKSRKELNVASYANFVDADPLRQHEVNNLNEYLMKYKPLVDN